MTDDPPAPIREFQTTVENICAPRAAPQGYKTHSIEASLAQFTHEDLKRLLADLYAKAQATPAAEGEICDFVAVEKHNIRMSYDPGSDTWWMSCAEMQRAREVGAIRPATPPSAISTPQ